MKPVLFLLTLLTSPLALAQLEPLSILMVRGLDFGIMTSDINECRINQKGRLVRGCIGPGGFAEFEVRGEPFTTISMNLTRSKWINNVRIIPKTVKSQTYVLDSNGFLLLRVRGFLKTRDGATPGPKSLGFTVTISYL